MMKNDRFPLEKRSDKLRWRQSQRGQIVVEYVLLLAVAVSLAVIITKTLVGRQAGDEGFVIQAWQSLEVQLGQDKPDDVGAAATK